MVWFCLMFLEARFKKIKCIVDTKNSYACISRLRYEKGLNYQFEYQSSVDSITKIELKNLLF